jgi:hypothetical protein
MTGVYANGIPKSGTHALAKTIQLLGVPCEVSHYTHDKKPADDKVVVIFRDPKNILTSWVRFLGRQMTQGAFIEQLQIFCDIGMRSTLDAYEPYLSDDSTLCVRYEELLTDAGVTVSNIANFLGVPVLDDCYTNIEGFTRTWNPTKSDWREHWTDNIDSAWVSHGCREAAERMGYY